MRRGTFKPLLVESAPEATSWKRCGAYFLAAGLAAAAGAAALAPAAGFAPAAAAGAAGAAVCAEPTGALGEGILIEGPPAGLGGRLMRTVCFFCIASAGFGGSEAGVGAGGTGEVGSDIGNYLFARR